MSFFLLYSAQQSLESGCFFFFLLVMTQAIALKNTQNTQVKEE